MGFISNGKIYSNARGKGRIMVELGIILGIYGYLVFSLGILGRLGKVEIFLITIPFLVYGLFRIIRVIREIGEIRVITEIKKDKLIIVILGLLGIQILINFLGAISPELSFDALWYHLTSARLYIEHHQIFSFPGWLMWPANLPRLTEMYYTAALLFSNEIAAKLIHFFFGLLGLLALFGLLRRYLTLRFALLGVLTFYTMLIVGWQSTTTYVDLARTFFEILALDLFLRWNETKKDVWLWESAVMVGLVMATKILALGTLGAFGILIFLLKEEGIVGIVGRAGKFIGLALLIVSPWFLFSFGCTGSSGPSLLPNIVDLLKNFITAPFFLWQATLKPDDIISPIYLIFLPLVLIFIWKQSAPIKITALYFLLAIFLAPTQSNRYLLPYLPALTLVTFSILEKQKDKLVLFVSLVIFTAGLNMGSRMLAARKFVPYLLGKETKTEFLNRNLNFSYGDFYDVDGWFKNNIQKDDLVLVYGIHNLYYLDFPYVHESWAKPGTSFTHILVGNNEKLPAKFGNKILLYQNSQTKVKVYLFGGKI